MIVRTEKQRRFTTVDNAPFEDKRLRWDTRGLLAYLLTKPNGWEIRIEDLLKQEEPEDGGRATGREKVFRMLRELKACGYLYRAQENGPDGRFVTVCTIYENPADNPHFGKGEEGEEPDEPETVDGFADHGEAVDGFAAYGEAGDGFAVDGFADRIGKTDKEVITEGRGRTKEERKDGSPPHLRQVAALHGVGLSEEGKRLQIALRSAFAFRNPEDSLDAARDLLAAGVHVWAIDHQELLDALRKVSKGVAPATLFRDWLTLVIADATAAEVLRLFGNSRETSWWVASSGMRGQPWPSQVANNIAVARYWEEAKETGSGAETAADARQTSTKAISSLQAFAQRAAAAQATAEGGR